jgi:hypothetical protein
MKLKVYIVEMVVIIIRFEICYYFPFFTKFRRPGHKKQFYQLLCTGVKCGLLLSGKNISYKS